MIFESKHATVNFNNTVPCIIWTPNGYLKKEAFREPFRVGMDFLEKNIKDYPNLSWLNDCRKLKMAGIEDVKWLNKNVNDRAYRFGVSKVAFVLPKNLIAQWDIKLYIEFTRKRSDNQFDIKAFKSIKEAKKWLMGGKGRNVEFP